jgi:hypothetical protein
MSPEEKALEERRRASDGNKVIDDADEGTTFEREAYHKKHLGKRYLFKGTVFDVESEKELTVMLEVGEYADVRFDSEDISHLKKDNVIAFSATINAFGTGLLINHELGEAKIETK